MRRVDPGARIYSPWLTMPWGADAVREAVHFCVWDRPWDWRDVFDIGTTVFLKFRDMPVIEWETRIVELIAVPFESAEAFRDMLVERWDRSIGPIQGESPAPGFGIAWRAEPIRHLELILPAAPDELPDWCAVGDLDEKLQAALAA